MCLEDQDGYIDFFVDQVLTEAKERMEGKLCQEPQKKRSFSPDMDKESDDLFERLIEDTKPADDDDEPYLKTSSIMDQMARKHYCLDDDDDDDEDDTAGIELPKYGDDDDDDFIGRY